MEQNYWKKRLRCSLLAVAFLLGVGGRLGADSTLLAKALEKGDVSWWSTHCEEDAFTDERVCILRFQAIAGVVLFGHTDNRASLVFGAGHPDFDSYADDRGPFMARVDGNPALNLMGSGRLSSNREMLLVAFGDGAVATELVRQMATGAHLKIRVGTLHSYQDLTIPLVGFAKAWNEFAAASPLSWARDIHLNPAAAPAATPEPTPTPTPAMF